MTVQTVTTARCHVCDWRPDPTRRMGVDGQANEHTNEHKHATTTHTRPADVTRQPNMAQP